MSKGCKPAVILMALLLALAGCGQGGGTASSRPAAADGPAPRSEAAVSSALPAAADFTADTYDGVSITLSDYFGKPLLLNFSGTWCGPCKMEYPELQRLHDEYGEAYGLVVVSLGDSAADCADFYPDNGYTFPVIPDPDGTIAEKFDAAGAVPQSFFINADGQVTGSHLGATTLEVFLRGLGG